MMSRPNPPSLGKSWNAARLRWMSSIMLAAPLLALVLEFTGNDDSVTGLLSATVFLAVLLPTAGTHRRLVAPENMDERELDWHIRVRSKAYYAYGVLVMASLMTYGLAEWFLGAPALTGQQLAHLALGFGIYLVALPLAYAAWFMPGPTTDEEGEA